ncbi:hypothetical protein AB6A40_001898 [Gnathostoma spinigerum]|uniref:Uncharacterized protein n=1 Tax=Gnathostoma spinigerum TaxID=75299 RepID=A0ABD6EAN0_9BILA
MVDIEKLSKLTMYSGRQISRISITSINHRQLIYLLFVFAVRLTNVKSDPIYGCCMLEYCACVTPWEMLMEQIAMGIPREPTGAHVQQIQMDFSAIPFQQPVQIMENPVISMMAPPPSLCCILSYCPCQLPPQLMTTTTSTTTTTTPAPTTKPVLPDLRWLLSQMSGCCTGYYCYCSPNLLYPFAPVPVIAQTTTAATTTAQTTIDPSKKPLGPCINGRCPKNATCYKKRCYVD